MYKRQTTHEAGDYLRHLPELISIVPVGPTTNIITEVTITEVHKTDSSIVRVISTLLDDVIDITVIGDTTELTAQQQIEVDNSDIQLIYEIALIPPTSYATSLNSYISTQITTNVGNSINVTVIEDTIQLTEQKQIEVDNSDLKSINQITIIFPTLYATSLNSYSSTQITTNVGNSINVYDAEIELINQITTISSPINSAAVNSYSSTQIVTNIGDNLEIISLSPVIQNKAETLLTTTINVITNVYDEEIKLINEITIISLEINLAAVNSYSSTQIVTNIGDNLAFIYNSAIIQNKVETTLTTTINIITFVQNKLPINSLTLTEDTEITSVHNVETGIVDYFEQSEDVKFVNKYNLGNAGFNLKAFENNAFVDTGSFDINGTLESIDLAYPLLTIENFEIQPNSSITLTGDIFNLGIPTINSVGTFITSNVIPSQTTILVQSTERFPANGKLLIGKEIVYYNGKTQNSFTGLIRGFDNTIAGSHISGDYLRTFD